MRNKGRTTANDVSVRIRFVLHTGDAKQFVDKEFIVINHETFLPPSGHQPVRKIRLRYKQGEDKFGLLLEIENTKENMIIERNWQWYPLPLFSSSGLNYYIVSIAVDGANLRDKDKELEKYSLSFAKEKPLIIPMESDVSDLFARLDI